MLDEEQIIQDILRGNKEAFRSLVVRYQKPVFRIIYQLVSDSHSVEDIAQETFIAAYEKLATHDPDRSEFSTWLFTIARNKSLNYIRKKKWLSGAFDQEAALQANPSDALCTKELFVQLNQVLDRLPGEQKRAFVLSEFENLPYEKIAQIECASLGTIRSRIFRAKQKLRKAFEQISGDQP
jgi:RNA polymerase sigma-70 factor (ECF subfamily)